MSRLIRVTGVGCPYGTQPSTLFPGRHVVLFLVAAFLVLAVLVGAAAYLPWPVTAIVAAVVAVWLGAFAARERRRRRHRARRI